MSSVERAIYQGVKIALGYSAGYSHLYVCRYSESTGAIDWRLDGKGPRLK